MTQQAVAIVVSPADETIHIGPLAIRFLLTGAQTNESAAIFEVTVPAGEKLRSPDHSHNAYDETAYGLEGTLTWTVEGQSFEIGPRQALCIPRGAVHRFDNFGDVSAKVLMIASPAAIGPEFFREAAAAMTPAGGGPPDPVRLMEIKRQHGLTPVLGS